MWYHISVIPTLINQYYLITENGHHTGRFLVYNLSMSRQLIPHIRPNQIQGEPDQVCNILNRVIDELNHLIRQS